MKLGDGLWGIPWKAAKGAEFDKPESPNRWFAIWVTPFSTRKQEKTEGFGKTEDLRKLRRAWKWGFGGGKLKNQNLNMKEREQKFREREKELRI